jgi:hypothetical protein
MKKFLALYTTPREEIDRFLALPDEEREEAFEAEVEDLENWALAHKASIVDPGSVLGMNQRLDVEGAANLTNDLTGYVIVRAEDDDHAALLFEDHPVLKLPGAYIELMECLEA